MLKVVVYDGGWGGELVADYLERELTTVEIVRVIDWAHAPYEGRDLLEIVELTEANLRDYIGEVAAIVLGGYVASMGLELLKQRHPEQIFIGLGINYDRILHSRNYPEKVVVLMDQILKESSLRIELRQKLLYSTLILPDCSGWEDLINRDLMTEEYLRTDLAQDFYLATTTTRRRKAPEENVMPKSEKRELLAAIERMSKLAEMKRPRKKQDEECAAEADEAFATTVRRKYRPDVVLLLNTHFWGIRRELEEIFGWKVRVLDFREKLLRDTCSALKLRGVDGKRSK